MAPKAPPAPALPNRWYRQLWAIKDTLIIILTPILLLPIILIAPYSRVRIFYLLCINIDVLNHAVHAGPYKLSFYKDILRSINFCVSEKAEFG